MLFLSKTCTQPREQQLRQGNKQPIPVLPVLYMCKLNMTSIANTVHCNTQTNQIYIHTARKIHEALVNWWHFLWLIPLF